MLVHFSEEAVDQFAACFDLFRRKAHVVVMQTCKVVAVTFEHRVQNRRFVLCDTVRPVLFGGTVESFSRFYSGLHLFEVRKYRFTVHVAYRLVEQNDNRLHEAVCKIERPDRFRITLFEVSGAYRNRLVVTV